MTFAELVRTLGAKRAGGQWLARCLAHEDGTPSLAIRIGANGRPLFKCHAGCDQASIIEAMRQRELRCDDVQPVPLERTASHAERTEKARACWHGASPAVGSLAESYLRVRAITLPPPATLRFASEVYHHESRDRLPALVAAVTVYPSREVVAVHRIFLRRDGSGKANVSPAKKSLGPLRGGAVRLAPAGERLGLAEGIEDALSMMQLDPTLPCWAVLGTANFSHVVLPPLPLAAEITIIADNDGPGRAAADAAAKRFRNEGRCAHVALPPEGHKDFNAYLLALRRAA